MLTSTQRNQAPSGMMNLEQACLYLGISDYLLRRLIRERKIPFVQFGRQYFFRQAVLDAHIAAQEAANLQPQESPAPLPSEPATSQQSEPSTVPTGIRPVDL